MPSEQDLLNDLLKIQGEIRAMEQEDYALSLEEPSPAVRHGGVDAASSYEQRGEKSYVDTSPSSIPAGSVILISQSNDPGGTTWADHPRSARNDDGSWTDAPCTNGTTCGGIDFCYSDYDCDPSEMCVEWQCVPKDPNRPCNRTSDCPADYVCDDNRCKLPCQESGDCELGFACNNEYFLCEPGCESDEQCDANSANPAPDATSNAICVNFECVRPCEPDLICDGPNDFKTCPEGTYCADRLGRAPGDPTGAIYNCVSGCATDSQCPSVYFTEPCDTSADPYCQDEEFEFKQFCVENNCTRPCTTDSNCATQFDEACVDGVCQTVGSICLADDDCSDTQFCNGDGRCASGCRGDSDCRKQCEPIRECFETCPPDPTCTCELMLGDPTACDPNDTSWYDLCPRDPACLGACPRDPDCLASFSPNAICEENSCIVPCPCEEGQRCETPEGQTPRCRTVSVGSTVERCWTWEETTTLPNGDIEIVERQECAFVSPAFDDDFYGCNCGEKCTSNGRCAPGVCTADSDCESCSYCKDGICVPGCDDENPCPAGECCQTDGKCHLLCASDGDCPSPEMCLAGGCCGIACEPVVPCNKAADCQEGEICNGAGICEFGCRVDSDCPGDFEVCYQQSCQQSCSDPEGCGEGRGCGSNGFCIDVVQTCQNDNDCGDGQVCKSGKCADGCRTDEECGSGGFCTDGECSFYCQDDAECAQYDEGDRKSLCRSDEGSRKAIQKRYNHLLWMKATGQPHDPAELARYEILAVSGNPGKCVLQAPQDPSNPSPEGRTGCECYEICDEVGRCERGTCSSNADCERDLCGDCLTDGKCGFCKRDQDCPSPQVCDIPEGETEGSCLVPCIPETPCDDNTDCPEDSYCAPHPRGIPFSAGGGSKCLQGCRDSSNCLPGQSCYNHECLPSCSGDSDCNTETELCLNGVCSYVGFACVSEADCPSDQSWCLNGYCEEDTRCNSDDDCSTSEVCNTSLNTCVQGDRCTSATDCGANRYCSTRGVCEQGQACSSDGGCNYPLICHEGGCKFKRRCNGDTECFGFEFCDGGFCGPDTRCDTDDDCFPAYACNPSGRCVEWVDSRNEPAQLGCDSCTETCDPSTFRCIPAIIDSCLDGDDQCKSDEECEDGEVCFCRGYGEDKRCYCEASCNSDADCEEGICECRGTGEDRDCYCCADCCRSDSDCEEGVCFCEGSGDDRQCYCVECRNDQDCINEYGEDDLVCVDNACLTPCYTGLSDGDCFAGLNYGDACGACSDKCPSNSSCLATDQVCGTYETMDSQGNRRTRAIPCRECSGSCVQSSQCEGESICQNGQCVAFDGRCNTSSDCAEYALKNGIEMYCQENQCVESLSCIGTSDCENDEICIDGVCTEAECESSLDCGEGSNCVDGQCGFQCNVQAITCQCSNDPYEPEIVCPFGYDCNCQTYLCSRSGYPGIQPTMDADSCPTGMYCDTANQTCRAIKQDVLDCFADSDCPNGVCDRGLCVTKNDQGKPIPDPETDPRDDENIQDLCEKKGMCCGHDGFCIECACDEDHPCTTNGECCDSETGLCVNRDEHPQTKYGAPKQCSFGKVFCEVLGPGGDGGTRNTIDPTAYKSEGYQGCKFVYEDENGYPLLERRKECWSGADLSSSQIRELLEQDCSDEDEDRDCSCDDLPPEEDECRLNFDVADCGACMQCASKTWHSTPCCPIADEDGNSSVTRNLCQSIRGENAPVPEDCGCLSDDDCSQCERCSFEGGGDGVCKADCENLCPCGGDTSTEGRCPTCEERFGACVENIDQTLSEPYVDENTGETVPARTNCECRVKRENPCCETFVEPADALTAHNGCRNLGFTDENGTTTQVQVDYCVDFKAGICAECTEDSHCSGTRVCAGFQCLSQCGQENAIDLEVGDCSCCTEDGTCKELFETWSESRNVGSGDEEQAQTRPCTCTENGIDCAPYLDSDSCYKWVPSDGQDGTDEDQAKADRDQNLARLQYFEQQDPILKGNRDQALIDRDIACGTAGPACNSAQSALSAADQAYENNLYYMGQLDLQLRQSVYRPKEYTQARTCDCCVDGQCREDEECYFGTCYVCITESTGYYSARLRTNVLDNEVCTGCTHFSGPEYGPAPGGCPTEAQGAPAGVVYEANSDGNCIKYRCEDGLSIHQELCTGTQNSWYEYCTGSIIGCVFSCQGQQSTFDGDFYNYWNGWEYTIDCEDAGLWGYNSNSEGSKPGESGWAQLSSMEQDKLDTICAYPNPIGCIRGNWIPTFVDNVQIHPCCHKANVISMCDPEHPNCQAKIELLYEQGDSSNLLKRLKQQATALENYIAYLEALILQLDAIKAQQTTIKEDAEQAIRDLGDAVTQIEQDIATAEDEKATLEDDLSAQQDVVADAQTDMEDAKTKVDEKNDELKTAIDERDDLQEQIDILVEDLELAEENNTNAKSALKLKNKEVIEKRAEIDGITLSRIPRCVCTDPGCEPTDPDSIFCLDTEQDLIDAQAELVELEAESEALQQAMETYHDEITDLSVEIARLEVEELKPKQKEVDRLQQEWSTLHAAYGTELTEYTDEVATMGQINQALLDNNLKIVRLQKQLESAIDQENGTLMNLEAEVEQADIVLGNVEESYGSLNSEIDEVQGELDEKQKEIDRLEAALDAPIVPETSGRPDQGKTSEELREMYADSIKDDQEAAEEKWYPE